jgi:hypothetical protein
MKRLGALLGILAMLGGYALAQDKGGTPTNAPQMTAEQRSKMAEAHEKLAACLRSDRPLSECRDEMMKSHESMDMGDCPMMHGKGPMKHGHGAVHHEQTK